MAKRKDIPQFGPLAGTKVVHASTSIAGPFCAQMYAEMGADVIWIENNMAKDVVRGSGGWGGEQDRRNQRNLVLNIPSEEGRKVFLKLLKEADVFIEASRGGQYAKWGLTDEVLWEQNPALVIVHVSGFGQTGLPDYVGRSSYDPIAQAFGCMTSLNGYPDRPPIPAVPRMGDFIPALFALGYSLAALQKAKETGVGESIDAAQYELLIRCQFQAVEYANTGRLYPREGNHNNKSAGWGSYPCKDGQEVYLILLGEGVYRKALPLLGLEYGSELFPEGTGNVPSGTSAATVLEERIRELCNEHTAAEVESILSSKGVPASLIMTYPEAIKHPHYMAREVFTEWEKVNGDKFKGINLFPKLKNNPGKIWRGMPTYGMDNDDILEELGYSSEDISTLYQNKTIAKD